MRSEHIIDVVPAVLVRTYEELCSMLERIAGAASVVQIDVVDGVFAPTSTWPFHDEMHFPRIVSGEEGMPLWDEIDFEYDLMVENPAEEVEQFVAAGATRIVLHARSSSAVEALAKLQDARAGELPLQVGLALPPGASVQELSEFQNQFDYLQVMGIEHLGVQGQELSHHVYELIKELRRAYPDKLIQLDGGVRVENVSALIHAGVDRLITGSAVFGTEDPIRALRELHSLANR